MRGTLMTQPSTSQTAEPDAPRASPRRAESRSQFALLRERRFGPFFWTQFAGAANDNVFKNAFVVFVTFEAARRIAVDAGTIVNLIGAVFILPFMLVSATAGQLADKSEKSRLIRWIKLFEVALMLVGATAVVLGLVVGGDAQTTLIIGGAVVGLVGLYQYLL